MSKEKLKHAEKKTVAKKAQPEAEKSEKEAEAKEHKEEKREKKAEAKGKKAAIKPVKKEHKPKAKISKPAEVKKIQALIKRRKKSHPVFRGRFGRRHIRSMTKAKWNKWRKPRGIDIIRKNEDGALPDTGYMQDKSIRYRHPSGYLTALVNNVREVELLSGKKDTAAVIAGTVGVRKRKEIAKKASELGIVILNRGK